MKQTVNIFIYIWEFILDLFFPIFCFGCKEKGEILCDSCQNSISLTKRETGNGIIALYDYRDPLVKKVIWQLKYFHHYNIGYKLGQILFSELVEEIAEIKLFSSGQSILVIPVPISEHKTKIRGYNQAFKIAKGFVEQGNMEGVIFEIADRIIVKSKDTIPQAQIKNRAKRLKNIIGVFKIKDATKIKGRTIIIIDDVTTTGGTIKEIIKILKKAGARKVIGFAVAH